MVLPLLLTPTDQPKKASPLTASEAVSLAVKVDVFAQPPTGMTKTYAAPWLGALKGAPATMVVPSLLKLTEKPKLSPLTESEEASMAWPWPSRSVNPSARAPPCPSAEESAEAVRSPPISRAMVKGEEFRVPEA